MAAIGFRWIKALIHGISWQVTPEDIVITNFLHDSADFERRASSSLE